MDIRARHQRAMQEFDDRIRQIPLDRWTDPTPCLHWDVATLVHHVVDEQRWVPLLLGGATVEQAAAELADRPLGGDLVEAWDEGSNAARDAVDRHALEGNVHTSTGEIPAAGYVEQLSLDLAIHAWDLARAIGANERLDEELVDDLVTEVAEHREELEASEAFADPVPVQPTADAQTRLLAQLGRAR